MTELGDLLAELAQLPRLPGASCRGLERLFDQTLPEAKEPTPRVRRARKQAVAVCASCPVLAECRAWVDSLPRPKRPRGVVAGTLTMWDGRRYKGRRNGRSHAA